MKPANKINKDSKADILDNLKELPTLPTVIAQLMMTLNEPTSSSRDLERLITNDQAIAARLLKLANSAFYGLPGKVTSLGRAITLLGFNTVRSLVLTIGVIDKFSGKSGGRYFDRGEFWEHSLSVAMISKLLCAKDPTISPDEAHIAGLLHDIGKVIMDTLMLANFQKAMRMVKEKGMDPLEAEEEFVGITHPELGAIVGEKWRFPEFILETTSYHHNPFDAKNFPEIVQLIALANTIVPAFKQQELNKEDYKFPELPEAWTERWIPDPKQEEIFITKYEVEIEKVRDILSLFR